MEIKDSKEKLIELIEEILKSYYIPHVKAECIATEIYNNVIEGIYNEYS